MRTAALGHISRTRSLVLSLLAVASLAQLAHAQAPTAGSTAAQTPAETAISVVQIPEYAGRTDDELRAIRANMSPDPRIASTTRDMPAVAGQIEQLGHGTTVQIASGLTPSSLEDVARQWRQHREQLSDWVEILAARLQVIERDTGKLDQLEELWARTAAQAQEDDLPDAVRAPIRAARAGIRETQSQLRSERAELLDTLGHLSGLQTEVIEGLAQLQMAEQRLRRDLFVIDGPPLWTLLRQFDDGTATAAALRAGLDREFDLLRVFFRQQRGRLATHAILVLVILAFTITLSRRQRALADDTPAAVRVVLARPISATVLLGALLFIVLYPYAPIALGDLAALVVMVVVTRLVRCDAERAVRRAVALLAALLLLGLLRRLLLPLSPAARCLLLVQDVVICAWLLTLLRSKQVASMDIAPRWERMGRLAGWLVFGLLALAVAGNVIGNVSLAMVFTEGTLHSAFAGLGVIASARVFEGLFIAIIASSSAQRVRSIANHGPALCRWAVRAVRAVMVLSWGALTLDLFALLTLFVAAVQAALAAQLTIGAVSLSLGTVLSVLLTVWGAALVAQIVRAVLADDILPRLSLPRGVPAAISAAANYFVLVLGSIVALSAAGIDPGRVALIAGALSVGIGFGLQTVVNNFVSGLILLVERPIQLGDTIEVDTVTGQVRHIGIRSSTVATFDGAEVIIPNATLISERVVNWTLSNFQRRIEIKVGVAYGSEPAQVLQLLEGAARDLPDLLTHPAPQAIFIGFGDSSLDFALRAWTDRQDMLGVVRSRLALAIHDALRTAGVEIPFPQRDVHVRSVDPTPRTPSDKS